MTLSANASAASDWPLSGWVQDMRPGLRAAREGGQAIALATLIAVDGPSPRDPGAQMLFHGDVALGFFSGGCVEGDIATHAAQVIADGEPRRLVYGRGSPFADIRLVCGGRIEILVERIAPDDPAVAALLAAADARRPVLWRTDGHARACLDAGSGVPAMAVTPAPFSVTRRCDPAWRMLVVGGDPTALALAALAAQSGLETTLCRPGGPACGPPLPGVAYASGASADVLAALRPDAWTAIAVATHALEADEAALEHALPSAAAYVGALGSVTRLAERLARLRRLGVPEAAIARLRAPIGLPIPGKTPWAVAVSVMAEVFQAMAERRDPASAAQEAA